MVAVGLTLYLALATVTDLWKRRIPNWLTGAATVSGLLFHLLDGGWQGGLRSVVGALAGFGIVFLLYLPGAVGAGDVKLFAGIGALGGVEFAAVCILYSVLFAGAWAVLILLWKKLWVDRLRKAVWLFVQVAILRNPRAIGKTGMSREWLTMPFMIAVVPGAVTAWFILYQGVVP